MVKEFNLWVNIVICFSNKEILKELIVGDKLI